MVQTGLAAAGILASYIGVAVAQGCGEGFELVQGDMCVDIDECARETSGCASDCINTYGSFLCVECDESDMCFVLGSEERMSWDDARTTCEDLGEHWAIACPSTDDQVAIAGALGEEAHRNVWTGYKGMENSAEFMCYGPGGQLDNTGDFWKNGQANGSGPNACVISKKGSGILKTIDCDSKRRVPLCRYFEGVVAV